MIPHIIHYCWFGHNPKPGLIKKCIESWKEYCPGWEIREWNEDNYDVFANDYTRSAYENKKWAYVADYARFDVLNRCGGVYFDTDVELLKPIPEELMEEEAFTGFETPQKVAPGLVFGTIPAHQFIQTVLDRYSKLQYSTDKTVVDIITELLDENGLIGDNSEQRVCGVKIMPTEYFGCFNHEIQAFEKTENTVSIHHYFASWRPWYSKARFKIIKYAARILGKERYLKIKSVIKKHG